MRGLTALLLASILLAACDSAPPAGPEGGEPCVRAGETVLYFAVGGTATTARPSGLRSLDAPDLAPVDSHHTRHWPHLFAVTPDGGTLIARWNDDSGSPYLMRAVHAGTGEVLRSVAINPWAEVAYDPVGGLLAVVEPSSSEPVRFYAESTFDLLWEAPLGELRNPDFSADGTRLYAVAPGTANADEAGAVIAYDVRDRVVVTEVPLYDNDTTWRWSWPTDLEASPDGRIYVATIDNTGGINGGGGLLHVVDPDARVVVDREPAGNFAQIAIDPTGRFVYVTDPGSVHVMSLRELRRYDAVTATSEVWARSLRDFGLDPAGFRPAAAAVSADGASLYLSFTDGSASTPGGEVTNVVRVDVATRRAMAVHGFSRNKQGYITELLQNTGAGLVLAPGVGTTGTECE
jgi:DNA-binding beta-propeller fold protein YncE